MLSRIFNRKNKENKTCNRITVTGRTSIIEGQAVVIADNTDVYYVEGMSEWDKDWLDRTVRITGDIEEKGAIVQRLDKRILRAAVVMLIQIETVFIY